MASDGVRSKKRLNVRLVLWLTLTLVVVTAGVYLLHKAQVSRSTAILLEVAADAERAGDQAKQLKYLRLYLIQNPGDTDTLARYGAALAKHAATPRARLDAYLALEQVVRRDAKRHESRKLLVAQALDPALARFADAKDHLNSLIISFPAEGQLRFDLGRCEEGLGKYAAAATHHAEAIRLSPELLDAYARLARLKRRQLNRPAEADKALEALVTANSANPRAWLMRAAARRALAADEKEGGRDRLLAAADGDLGRARALAPDDADILLEAGELARARGDRKAARAALARGSELHPRDARFYSARARVEVQDGLVPDAVVCLRDGLKQLPDHRDLLWDLAHLVIQGGEAAEAEKIEARLRRDGFPAPLLECLGARVSFQKGRWLDTVRRLERVRAVLGPWPQAALQADLLLGASYERLGDGVQQLAALRRAVGADPFSEAANLGLGDALSVLGQFDKAFEAYRAVASRSGRANFLAARALILRTLSLPLDRRSWAEAESYVSRLSASAPDSPEAAILRAEILVGQNQFDKAQECLIAATQKQPERPELWAGRAAILQRQGKSQEALDLLDQGQGKAGERVELRLARLRIWAGRGGPEAEKALRALAASSTLQDDPRAGRGLADAWLRLGKRAEAERIYATLAERDPTNLGLRQTLFDLAVRGDNDTAARKALDEMRAIEGDEGTLWRFGTACLLLKQARTAGRRPDAEVQRLLAAVAARRGGWSRLALAEAELEELSGRPTAAIGKYQKAIEAGERSPAMIGRAVELLHQRRRYLEAAELLRKLEETGAPPLQGLDRMAAEIALFQEDSARALQLARRAVTADNKNPRQLLWLGQMLYAAKSWDEAESVLRRAVEAGPKAPETWVTLAHYLARRGHKEKAESILKEATTKLPPDQAGLALAQGWELIGNNDRAGELYQAALKKRPEDPQVLANLARFSLRTNRAAEAEAHLRTLADLEAKAPDEAAWAKRLLAIILVSGSDYHRARSALAILDPGGESKLPAVGDETNEERRARAVVLAGQHNRRQRLQAITLLEELVRKVGRADDRTLLAQLYEATGDTRKAEEQHLALLSAQPDNANYLALRAQYLLGRKRLDEAEAAVARLAKAEPGTFRTLRLQARLLHARGRGAEAVAPLEALAAAKPGLLAHVANALQEAGQFAAAEKAYRTLLERDKEPRYALVLATSLGRRDRAAEALQLCAAAWKTCPPGDVAVATVDVLHAAKVTPEQLGEVARHLEAAAQRWPKNADVLGALAALRRRQGRDDLAIAQYRQVVQVTPDDALALNNLAWVLALADGRGEEALRLIDKAIDAAGPRATLLDTRGVIHLVLGQTGPAIRDLEEAVADTPAAAGYFHLAQAYLRAGQRAEAAAAWRRARQAGLSENALDSLDRPAYRRLAGELAAP